MAQFRVWISVTRTSFSLSLSLESHAFVNVCARWYWDRNGWVKAAAEAERPTAQQTKSDITKDLWFQLFWVTVTWLHVCEILCELIIIQDQPRSTAQTQEETERAAKRIKRDGLALERKKLNFLCLLCCMACIFSAAKHSFRFRSQWNLEALWSSWDGSGLSDFSIFSGWHMFPRSVDMGVRSKLMDIVKKFWAAEWVKAVYHKCLFTATWETTSRPARPSKPNVVLWQLDFLVKWVRHVFIADFFSISFLQSWPGIIYSWSSERASGCALIPHQRGVACCRPLSSVVRGWGSAPSFECFLLALALYFTQVVWIWFTAHGRLSVKCWRLMILLENVGALLSAQPACRKLFAFIQQVGP